jgi:hypothetical protein
MHERWKKESPCVMHERMEGLRRVIIRYSAGSKIPTTRHTRHPPRLFFRLLPIRCQYLFHCLSLHSWRSALSYPAMFRKISSAVTSVAGSLTGSPARQLPPNHHDPARAESYVELAKELQASGVPVSFDDCAACDHPCPPTEGSEGAGAGTIVEAGTIWEGKTYEQYVMDKYGDLGELPAGFDTDWESELAGSAKFGKGRVVVISTGKSDWERDHTVSKSESVGLRRLPSSHVLHFFRLPGLWADLRSGRGGRVRPQAGEIHLKSGCQGGERRQGRQGQGRQR